MTSHQGIAGKAERLDLHPDLPNSAMTVDHWLIDCPSSHPAWSQYVLYVVRLDRQEGWPEPHLEFEGASHELGIIALNPDYPMDREKVQAIERAGRGLHYLTPPSLAVQFEATDTEMREMASLACQAITQGALTPEKPLGYESHRLGWLEALTKTLAHLRGEEHDRT